MSDEAALNPIPPEAPVLAPGHTFATVTDKISAIVLTRPVGKWWLLTVAAMTFLVLVLTMAMLSLALFAIHRFFANLPSIVAFVTHDLPKIAAAIGDMLAALWARR